MEYNIEYLINADWWDKKADAPHPCLIRGDTSTRINLGWFELRKGAYMLTDEGERHYAILLNNDYSIHKYNQ